MDDVLTANSPVLFLFLYLLPGFLGMVVYGYFREGKPIQNFDRVVIAFVLALLSAICVHIIFGAPFVPVSTVTNSTPPAVVLQTMINLNLLETSIAAAIIAMAAALINNRDVIHKALIFLKVSNKTSDNDVWYDVFFRHRGFWVRLEFKDGRSLIGWPVFYSDSGSPRELFIADATWLRMNEAGEVISVDIDGPVCIFLI
jgi:hypothetical protein